MDNTDPTPSRSESPERIRQERDVLLKVVKSTRSICITHEKVIALLVLGGYVDQSIVDNARKMVESGFFSKALE